MSEEEYEEAKRAAKKLLEKAHEAEAQVTKVLQEVSDKYGARLAGLEHRFKGIDSLTRKAVSDVEWHREELLSAKANKKKEEEDDDDDDKAEEGTGAFSGGLSVEEIVLSIGDSLRYTMVPSFEQYTETVNACVRALGDLGVKLRKSKNFWEGGDHYQGLNMTFEHPTAGMCFELQFHTEQGLEVKHECHKY